MKHLFHFLVLKMKDFRNFILHNCIIILTRNKFQVTNFKNKKATAKFKPETLEKNGFSKTLYPKPKPYAPNLP